MVVFGGDLAGGSTCGATNDLWVLSNANGLGGTPTWTQLTATGGPPSVRAYATAVYDQTDNRMIVFGGNNQCFAPLFNDVWVLSNANGVGDTPTWTQLTPSGGPPSGRALHTSVYDAGSNTMTVFGGDTNTLFVADDVWVLSNANGLGGTPTWTQLTPSGTPPTGRNSHSAVIDPTSDSMTVFAGETSTGVSNDVWVLSNSNGLGGSPAWTPLIPIGAAPPARQRHTAVFRTVTNRMTIFAGGPAPGEVVFNDTWVLTDANGEVNTPGKVNGGGFIQPDGTMTPATLLIQSGINASVGDKATFGFGVQFAAGDPSPTGNLQYKDHGANVTMTSLSFTLLNIGDGVCGPNTHAKIRGSATVTGPSGVPSTQDFEVEVDDCGGPSSTPPDTFKITTTGPTSYMAMGPVLGGNITIHKQ